MAAENTVFVVDDDAAIRDSLELLLAAEGFAARSFASAREFLEAYQDDPGCLLADISMPEMSGLDLQRIVAQRHPDLPVIMITGQAEVPIAVEAMKAGAVDFIEKPFADGALLASIRQALLRAEESGRSRRVKGEATQRIGQLTGRERQVLEELVLGHQNKVIAYNLSISPRTVEIHRARIMQKVQVRSLSELVRLAVEAGKPEGSE